MASLKTEMEAYAFRQLVAHLQWRTDVQNIDIMNLAGFCRNCLSKWYWAGSKEFGVPMTYDEATQHVYGMNLSDFKKKYQGKANDEQMKLFNDNSSMHAKTDWVPNVAGLKEPHAQQGFPGPPAGGGHSSVCGVNDCDVPPPDAPVGAAPGSNAYAARVGILTVSDRASKGVYADESGPAAQECLQLYAERHPSEFALGEPVRTRVVPDEPEEIVNALQEWSAKAPRDPSKPPPCNVILTTGGTGLGVRDVTPEATKRVVTRLADGLSNALVWRTSFGEPRSALSRGICGVVDGPSVGQGLVPDRTLVVNLPGNPRAVREYLAVLLPVLPHALYQLQAPPSLQSTL